MSSLITIRTFSSSVDYEMVKAYLESFEIDCFGIDEVINRSYLANVNGGVKLKVREEQEELAIKLLFDGGYLKEEDFEPTAEIKWAEKVINYFKKQQ